MKAIVKNMKSVWNVCGQAAERCVKAAKREMGEYKASWADAEAYWIQHPEDRPEPRLNIFM